MIFQVLGRWDPVPQDYLKVKYKIMLRSIFKSLWRKYSKKQTNCDRFPMLWMKTQRKKGSMDGIPNQSSPCQREII
jgi:hypothetical protein